MHAPASLRTDRGRHMALPRLRMVRRRAYTCAVRTRQGSAPSASVAAASAAVTAAAAARAAACAAACAAARTATPTGKCGRRLRTRSAYTAGCRCTRRTRPTLSTQERGPRRRDQRHPAAKTRASAARGFQRLLHPARPQPESPREPSCYVAAAAAAAPRFWPGAPFEHPGWPVRPVRAARATARPAQRHQVHTLFRSRSLSCELAPPCS